MNKNYTILAGTFLALSAGLLSFNSSKLKTVSSIDVKEHLLNSGGATQSRTGAPGEATCTQCHGGTVQDGSTVIDLTFPNSATTFLPSETYSMNLNFSAGSAKNGFQLTVLDNANVMAGNLSSVDANTSISNGMGRQYLNHTFQGTSQTDWDFEWTSPGLSIDEVTFYVACNKTNSSSTTSGDVIYTHSMSFVHDPAAGIFELQNNKMDFEVGFNKLDNSLKINFDVLDKNNGFVSVVDLQGKVVFEKNLGEVIEGSHNLSFTLPVNTVDGIYIVNLMLGNNSASEKLMIQK